MAYEMLVGLNVTNEEAYQAYRNQMAPILENHGGGFRYDFQVSNVLKSETTAPINRVFIIFFRNEEAMNLFFSNDEYKRIKKTYFENSVTDTTIIARFNSQT